MPYCKFFFDIVQQVHQNWRLQSASDKRLKIHLTLKTGAHFPNWEVFTTFVPR